MSYEARRNGKTLCPLCGKKNLQYFLSHQSKSSAGMANIYCFTASNDGNYCRMHGAWTVEEAIAWYDHHENGQPLENKRYQELVMKAQNHANNYASEADYEVEVNGAETVGQPAEDYTAAFTVTNHGCNLTYDDITTFLENWKFSQLYKNARGINVKTYAKYRVANLLHNKEYQAPQGLETLYVFPYFCLATSELPAYYKLRYGYSNGEKTYKIVYNPYLANRKEKIASMFFGRQFYTGKQTILIITEGEFDCLALADQIHQHFKKDLAEEILVVSLPHGANSAKGVVTELEFLSRFSFIITMFDNDSAGRNAAQEFSQLCKSYLFNVKYRDFVLPSFVKDFNDVVEFRDLCGTRILGNDYYIANEIVKQLKQLVVSQRPMTEICSGAKEINAWADRFETKRALVAQKKYSTGSAILDEATMGFTPQNLNTIVAGTGVGKTTFLTYLAVVALKRGLRVLYVSYEVPLDVLCRQLRNTYKAMHDGSLDGFDQLMEPVDGQSQITVVYGNSDLPLESVFQMLTVDGKSAFDVLFFDHITAAADMFKSLYSRGTQAEILDYITGMLRRAAVTHNICIFAAVQRTKPASNSTNEAVLKRKEVANWRVPSLAEIRGSGGIAQYSTTVLGIGRIVYDNGTVSTANEIQVLKTPYGGSVGKYTFIYYDSRFGCFSSFLENNNSSGSDDVASTVENLFLKNKDDGNTPF